MTSVKAMVAKFQAQLQRASPVLLAGHALAVANVEDNELCSTNAVESSQTQSQGSGQKQLEGHGQDSLLGEKDGVVENLQRDEKSSLLIPLEVRAVASGESVALPQKILVLPAVVETPVTPASITTRVRRLKHASTENSDINYLLAVGSSGACDRPKAHLSLFSVRVQCWCFFGDIFAQDHELVPW